MPRRNRNATRCAPARWRVTDCAFNRANYPHLIGRRFATPPSYAAVEYHGRKRAA